jgi:hypothetical protein
MSEKENDKAPFFNTWGHWYVLLIVFQLLLVILFSLFTKRFL